jgi:NhaA family Na+:H+ antiporter
MTTRSSSDQRRDRPFQQFFETEAAGGIVLLFSSFVALVAANSPWAGPYEELLHLPISIGAGGHTLSLTLHQWINDALMALFFLLVGLEIKRELVVGELATTRQAALPIAAAVGGMVVPAALYWAITRGTPAVHGWAIPMATDIAFALGTLALIAPHAPLGVKVFLAALAIVDDMGAVAVIALFYSSEIAGSAVAAAAATLVLLMGMNRLGVRRLTPYLLVGLVLWFFVHESGIHATIAGVALALTIPTRSRINAEEFSREARALLDEFDRSETGDLLVLTSKGQQEAIFALERASEGVTEPLLRLEHALHSISAFVVMPLFAFANAGIAITGELPEASVAIGVLVGLAIGKPVGITLAAFGAVRLGYASLPRGVTWGSLHACGWLGGMGFTMSLFIATLAFDGTTALESAKKGILLGSFTAGIVAAVLMRVGARRP